MNVAVTADRAQWGRCHIAQIANRVAQPVQRLGQSGGAQGVRAHQTATTALAAIQRHAKQNTGF